MSKEEALEKLADDYRSQFTSVTPPDRRQFLEGIGSFCLANGLDLEEVQSRLNEIDTAALAGFGAA